MFYYGDYRVSGGTKQRYWHEWPCCAGTYIQLMAEFHNLVFFEDAEGICVNLFTPAELAWQRDGETVTVRQETEYPESDATTIAIDCARPVEFALRLRVPGWAKSVALSLNGAAIDATAGPGEWVTVRRAWSAADRLTMRLPMALRTAPVDAQHPGRAAIMYGPIVLAQDEACCRRPFTIARETRLETRLIREDLPRRFPITNTVPERHTRYLVPLSALPENQPYFLYFDLHSPTLY